MDFNHNKPQHGFKQALLNPWQDGNTSPNSARPRSYSLGCHPQEIRELLNKRGVGSLEISLDSFNACPKGKSSSSTSSNGYLKKSFYALLLITLISLVFYAYLAWTYNASIMSFLTRISGSTVSIEEPESNVITQEPSVGEEIFIEEPDDVAPQRLPRELPHEMQSTHQHYVPTEHVHRANNANFHQTPSQGMQQHSYRHQGSNNNGHSFVHRHYQHTGAYYVHHHPNAYVQHRVHANNHPRPVYHHHNEARARQSWLVEHMRHQQPADGRSYAWEASANKINEQKLDLNSRVTVEKQSGEPKIEENAAGVNQYTTTFPM